MLAWILNLGFGASDSDAPPPHVFFVGFQNLELSQVGVVTAAGFGGLLEE